MGDPKKSAEDSAKEILGITDWGGDADDEDDDDDDDEEK